MLACLSVALALWPGRARADGLLSPGELSKPHAKLEGIRNCTQCHQAGAQLSSGRCLDCHVELKTRIATGAGFHGRLSAPEKQACQLCHKEHRGRDSAIVEWAGGRNLFDHKKTGYPLAGEHRKPDCLKCHETRLIEDAAVKTMVAAGQRTTFLGVGTRCATCHADEHRGQFGAGADCKSCHTVLGFVPAIGFDHARAAFKLDGKHTQVSCEKCHKGESDPAAKRAFPAAMSEVFARFKPVANASCTACHKDPHQQRFGNDCARCHLTTGWSDQKSNASGPSGARAFHQTTAFPLKGAHEQVACKLCHGPFPGEKARYRGLAFQRCDACHLDAHVGQLARAGASPDCTQCHSEASFSGARFDVEEHDRARFTLAGAHRAVTCAACHLRDEGLKKKVPASVAKTFERRGLPVRVSPAVFTERGSIADCRTCHADAHAGQFDASAGARGCTACHSVEGFHPAAFDHQTQSKFPLEGKHQAVTCARCHASEGALQQTRARAHFRGELVRFRPVETACATCHADPHAGQFAKATSKAASKASSESAARSGGPDCTSCHSAAGWSELRFAHRPPFTSYLLEGGHQKASCVSCHPLVKAGAPLRRYRGTPVRCEQCHSDVHRGAFKELSR